MGLESGAAQRAARGGPMEAAHTRIRHQCDPLGRGGRLGPVAEARQGAGADHDAARLRARGKADRSVDGHGRQYSGAAPSSAAAASPAGKGGSRGGGSGSQRSQGWRSKTGLSEPEREAEASVPLLATPLRRPPAHGLLCAAPQLFFTRLRSFFASSNDGSICTAASSWATASALRPCRSSACPSRQRARAKLGAPPSGSVAMYWRR
jgi:hypothetical protein